MGKIESVIFTCDNCEKQQLTHPFSKCVECGKEVCIECRDLIKYLIGAAGEEGHWQSYSGNGIYEHHESGSFLLCKDCVKDKHIVNSRVVAKLVGNGAVKKKGKFNIG